MKAVYFEQHGELDVLRYGDVPDPELTAGRAVVRVRACALNYLDIWVRRGWPGLKLQMPHWCGADVAGEIMALGPGRHRLEHRPARGGRPRDQPRRRRVHAAGRVLRQPRLPHHRGARPRRGGRGHFRPGRKPGRPARWDGFPGSRRASAGGSDRLAHAHPPGRPAGGGVRPRGRLRGRGEQHGHSNREACRRFRSGRGEQSRTRPKRPRRSVPTSWWTGPRRTGSGRC